MSVSLFEKSRDAMYILDLRGGCQNKLPELIKAVEDGERATICRRGHPVMDIVWTQAPNSCLRKFGTMRGKIKIHDHNWWRPMTMKR